MFQFLSPWNWIAGRKSLHVYVQFGMYLLSLFISLSYFPCNTLLVWLWWLVSHFRYWWSWADCRKKKHGESHHVERKQHTHAAKRILEWFLEQCLQNSWLLNCYLLLTSASCMYENVHVHNKLLLEIQVLSVCIWMDSESNFWSEHSKDNLIFSLRILPFLSLFI